MGKIHSKIFLGEKIISFWSCKVFRIATINKRYKILCNSKIKNFIRRGIISNNRLYVSNIDEAWNNRIFAIGYV